MNAIVLAPSQVQPQSHRVDEPAVSLRLVPPSESTQTGDRDGPARAAATAPFWTWFIENPRRSRGV